MNDSMNMKNRIVKTLLSGLFIAVFMLLCPFNSCADPTITQSYTVQGDPGIIAYVNGVAGGDIQVDAFVGNSACEISKYGLIRDEKEIKWQTYILFDNSFSISQKNREMAKDTVARIVEAHTERERFSVYTFSKDVTVIAEGDNYSAIADAVRSITFADQDSYLISCLKKVMSSMETQDPLTYNRIILFSDGVDDESGSSIDSFFSEIEKAEYTCPIHIISSVWEKNRAGLQKLHELSRLTNGEYIQLDDYKDSAEASAFCQKDHGGLYFMLSVPLELKDGEEKALHLTVSSQGKSYALSRMVRMPELTEEDRAILASQVEEQEDTVSEEESTVPEVVEEKPATISLYVPPEVGVEEDKPEQPSFFTKYRIPILCGAGALLLLSVLIFVISSKKQASLWDEPISVQPQGGNGFEDHPATIGMPGFGGDSSWRDDYGAEDGLTIDERAQGGQGGGDTVGMFSSGVKVILDEIDSGNRHFETEVAPEAVIGRRAPCQVVVGEGEITVSKKHCRLISDINGLSVEDLGSRNGTFVNGTRVVGRHPLANGDTLKMGKLVCKVTIRMDQ